MNSPSYVIWKSFKVPYMANSGSRLKRITATHSERLVLAVYLKASSKGLFYPLGVLLITDDYGYNSPRPKS